jgi:26S proteasome regulatory subunit N10
VLLTSPLLAADRGLPDAATAVADPAASGSSDFDMFGVDPSLDPELAMALRMSMQEAQAREEAAAPPPPPPPAAPEEQPLLEQDVDVDMKADEDMDEDEAIARAIEMSMKGDEPEKK